MTMDARRFITRTLPLAALLALPFGVGAQRPATAATPPTKSPGAVPSTPPPPVLQREVFSYNPSGRRDPFVSLATTSDLRPLITDLKLVGVLADPSGRRSVAVLRDLTDKNKQYRVTIGSTLGRLRVTRITSRGVTFTVEEFGRNREEVLSYAGDSTRTRTP